MSAPLEQPPAGRCPSCEGEGPVGVACVQGVCERRGYHHIPADDFAEALEADLIDPLLGQRWGDCLLVRRLGSGAAGSVYLGLQYPLEMRVAVKVLGADTESAPLFVERFEAEARALARLSHPNIVRLLRFSAVGARRYIVMENVDGGRTLRTQLRSGLSTDEGLRVLRQMVNALEAAHAEGIVHRDIKPANVMLQSIPGEPLYVRLVDFGLAKFVEDGADTTRMLAGTPTYMAPEQVDRRNIGPWSDWFALGMIALELVLGARPFEGMGPRDIIALKRQPDWDVGANPDLLDGRVMKSGTWRGMWMHGALDSADNRAA